jgi:hypothetical protein
LFVALLTLYSSVSLGQQPSPTPNPAQPEDKRIFFNFSEIIGNSTAVAISTAYYPDNRTASNAVSKLGVQLGVDLAANILKEFWPDINRKFSRKHRAGKDEMP